MIELPSNDDENDDGHNDDDDNDDDGDDCDNEDQNEQSTNSKDPDDSIVAFYQKFSNQFQINDTTTNHTINQKYIYIP